MSERGKGQGQAPSRQPGPLVKRYLVIGWDDEVDRWRGELAQRFRPEHWFETDKLPAEAELRDYATQRGYLPRKGKGISQTKCRPVYYEKHEPGPPVGDMKPEARNRAGVKSVRWRLS